jgi:hypothetical protein
MAVVELDAVSNSHCDVERLCGDLGPFGEDTARTGGAEFKSIDARVSNAWRISVRERWQRKREHKEWWQRKGKTPCNEYQKQGVEATTKLHNVARFPGRGTTAR